MRNALAHAGPKQRTAVVALLKTIFTRESAEAARDQWHHVADALCEKYPKLAAMMDESRDRRSYTTPGDVTEVSAKRLSVTADLPKDWVEQRRELGFV